MTQIDLAAWGARRRRRFPPGHWAPLECKAVWDEAPDVRTFLLTPADGSRIEFDPGQFMTFQIETPDGVVERCYTIASSGARDSGIEITVKAQPGGASADMHKTLTIGATINAFGPSGRFGPMSWPDTRYALVCAGSGVTPMLSILRTAADRGLDLDAVLIQVTPTADDLIAADDLVTLKRRLPNLTHIPIVTRGTGASRPTSELLQNLIPDLSDRTVLCCGPQGFMEMIREAAREAEVPAERYGEESFDFSSPEAEITPDGDTVVHSVTFAKTGKVFECAETTTILAAIKEAGVALPSSCARGMCGTCKTFKHAGEVTMANEGGIRQREMDRGFILPCVSRPLTDIVLDC